VGFAVSGSRERGATVRAFSAAVSVMTAALLFAGAALADLKVMDTEDVVRLVTGEEIQCTVLAVGMKAVVVIVTVEDEDKEMLIPRRQVASITRGEVRPTIKGYQTEAIDGVKVVVGEGFRETEPAGGEEALAAGRPKGKKGRKRASEKAAIPRAKADELMKDPQVSEIVEKLGGRKKAMELLRQHRDDPRVKRYMDDFLKSGKLPKDLRRLFGK
jgi:hypothetical protein